MIPFNIAGLQPRAWSILARSFQSQRVAGTYLLCGPEGCGRWPLAITFAALLNCEHPDDSSEFLVPCGECRSCRLVFGLNFEGLHFAVPLPPHKNSDEATELTSQVLSAKREEPFSILSSSDNLTIPIDIGRAIKRRVSSRPAEGVYRAIIFYQMERMRPEAADALLKLIEEPPPRTVILLIARRAERLLPTIQSRAQKIVLGRSSVDAVAAYIEREYEIDPERADLLARISEGIVGQAVQMLDGEGEGDGSRREAAFDLFRSLLEDPPAETVSRLFDVVADRNRGDAEYVLELWQSLLRDCTNLAAGDGESRLVNVDFGDELKRLSRRFTDPRLALTATEEIKIALARFRLNVHIHGALAALTLKIKAVVA